MARVSAAFSMVTEQPYIAMVVDGNAFQLLDVKGEIPGGQQVIADMRALFGTDGLGLFEAFDLYAAAFGMTAAPSGEVEGSLQEVADATRTELVLEQGIDSGARRWSLQQVANARSGMLLDSAAMADESAYDPELGLDSAWSPETHQEFLRRAGWEPYLLGAPEEELAAALDRRMAGAAAAPLVEEEGA